MAPYSLIAEVRRTLALAFPIIVGQVGQTAMGIVDSVMIGRVGVVPLAASAFANSLFIVVFIASIGVLMSLSVLVARAHGARQAAAAAEYLRHGLVLGLALAVAGAAVLLALVPLLGHFGQPAEVVGAVKAYYILIAVSLVPALLFQVLRQYGEAVGHPWGPMAILLGGVGLNALLNWILIYGHAGAPALGLAGAGWATLAARVAVVVGLWFWLRRIAAARAEWPGGGVNPGWRAPVAWNRVREMLAIGLPAAGQLLFEVGAFAAAALMMGWLGTGALAAHQIALSCAGATFMVPLGLATATTVRVGRAVGEGRPAAVRTIGFGSLGLSAICSLVFTAAFVWAGPAIVAGFTSDVAVATLAVRLLIVAAVFQLFDGAQVVATGALRGLADVRVPLVISFVAYWVLALPTGYFLGVRGIGPLGVWIGLAVGLAVVAVLLARRLYVKTATAGL